MQRIQELLWAALNLFKGEDCSLQYGKKSKWEKQNATLLVFSLKNKSKLGRRKCLHRKSLQLLCLYLAWLILSRLSMRLKVSKWWKIKAAWDLKGFCAFKAYHFGLSFHAKFSVPNGGNLECNNFCELNCVSAMVLLGWEEYHRPDVCLMWLGSMILKIGCGLIQSEQY